MEWAELIIGEVKDELDRRGLTKSGKKEELVSRLKRHDVGCPK